MKKKGTILARMACLSAVLLASGSPAWTAPSERKADLCVAAATEASQATGVPLQVLLALTLTETGRSQDGQLQPWPWALNQGGDSHWFDTEEDALAYLDEAVRQGVGNIDVGCFQLNYRWHGNAFDSLESMMDPRRNALYAARLMGRLEAETGDWIVAAGAYHSATPDKAERYLARFEPIYSALDTSSAPAPLVSAVASSGPRMNLFPLLQPDGSRAAGSIVPIGASKGAIIGAP